MDEYGRGAPEHVWLKALERLLLAGFLLTMLWIVADWMWPKPREARPPQPSVGARVSGAPAAATTPGLTPNSSRQASVSGPPPASVASPFAAQPATFAIDPFADGKPELVVVIPEPPAPRLPADEQDARPETNETN